MEDIREFEIILIEDNPYDAELILRVLNKNKLANKTIWLKDGAEAMDFFSCRGKYKNRPVIRPKLILLDLKLPKVNGLEVLQELKKNEKTKVIPVVVLTSSKEEKDIVESYQYGVNSYITKPVDFDKFIKAVKEMKLYWLLINKPPETGC